MPDINNTAEEQHQNGAANNGEGDGAPASDKTKEGDSPEGGAQPSGEGKGEGEGGKDPKDKPENGAGGDNDEPQVRQRKSVKDFIIERQQKKIERLSGKKDGAQDPDNPGAGGDDDGEVDPADEELITKVVGKHFKPFFEKSLQAEDEQEIQDFLTDNPDFKPYEAKARKYMQHPSRRQIPIEEIFYSVAGKDLLKIGARKQKEADDDAARGNAGGGSSRGGGESKNVWDMPKEDFEKQQEAVRRKQAGQ
jgi:hypothetical protein